MSKTRLLLYCCLFLCCPSLFAQYAGDRFQKIVFHDIFVQHVCYGNNVNYNGQKQSLYMDVYSPKDDTLNKRPVVFFTHGGSFIGGTRKDADVVQLCRNFAQRGYVTISIDYRMGMSFPPDEKAAISAVYRATQDARAAVRFVRAKADSLHIHSNLIFFGGSSAGAFMALHLAYLDKPFEIPAVIDTSAYDNLKNPKGLDGLNGKTNQMKASSAIQGIISLCGALGDTSWIEPTDVSIPILCMHGDMDGTVPYQTDRIKIFGFGITPVNGSRDIDKRANHLGFHHALYTFKNADHVPYYRHELYMDTTICIINRFLYKTLMNGNQIKPEVDCPYYTDETNRQLEATFYPNTGNGELFVRLVKRIRPYVVFIYDQLGQQVKRFETTESFRLNLKKLSKTSLFTVKIQSDKQSVVKKILIK